ncbi:hypothetical protein NG895_03045 [Aeoliella sp. ICT_H6.2]|uniref:Uncharacterized protein n=1 Tax=Aeoliella straminimaris TaxID=2954799 RepID=A0A9X2FB89_9BACT|nr:hypothetical protein [Aeoliella straminimaris]MCO6042876.1 hypothetical protein [Aeoliella straminimaris]
MTRAEQCELLASQIGWAAAVAEVYGEHPIADHRQYARFLRGHHFTLTEITHAIKLRFNLGSPQTIGRWLNPLYNVTQAAYMRRWRARRSIGLL